MKLLLSFYRFVFCRPFFARFNYHLYKMSLRGLGVFNSEGNAATGERGFLSMLQQAITVDVVFDVGANTGEYTTEVQNFFPKASVYGFEPHPDTFKKLQNNIQGDTIFVFNQALGSRPGQEKLWDFANDAVLKDTQPTSTLASLQRNVIEKLHQQRSESFTVPVETIDNIVKKEKIKKISLLKIDTEGTEFDVLKGAKVTLKSNKIDIIQFEFNEMNAYTRTFMKDFVAILPEYTFFRLLPHGLYRMGVYRPATWEIFAFQNIVAVRNDLVSRIIS